MACFLIGIALGISLVIAILFPTGLIAMWAYYDKRKRK